MRLDVNSCSLSGGKVYDIEGVVLDYLSDPPQSTTNESELRYHYLFSYNGELNLLFLTQHDIIQHIHSILPPTVQINDKNASLTWNNLNTIQSDSIKMDYDRALDLIAPSSMPLGYKSILKLGDKIRIPKAILGFTGGRPVGTNSFRV